MSMFRVSIRSIQHVSSLELELDLDSPRLLCLVGRNGVGKTTLIRALRNLSNADTFVRTANPGIFNQDSRIDYQIDECKIAFTFDAEIGSLNCKQEIPKGIRESIVAELPMPYGARFNYFKSASDADSGIRQALVTSNYTRPEELIEFLSSVYGSKKYDALAEVFVKGRAYYVILLTDDRYIREDYLSSGEYFLINLYRTIKEAPKLIAVDEIELSLDAAAQAQLVEWLRNFSAKYGCTILFTTHSLAIMRTLNQSELRYVEKIEGATVHYAASYSYVKARLFGFLGWDRYVLTEDVVLKEFLEFIIRNYCKRTFFNYKVIQIGGGPQVADLLKRNEVEEFLASSASVIAVLDGDQRGLAYATHPAIHFIPIESVEKATLAHYDEKGFPFRLPQPRIFSGAKEAFNAIKNQRVATADEVYGYLCNRHSEAIAEFAGTLSAFLDVKG